MLSKYKQKKSKNQVLINFTKSYVTEKTQQRICECGNWIEFLADREVTTLKVKQANFCKNRFCPMCSWRLAKKDALKISILMRYIEQKYGKAFIFLTLTAPNVKGENLGQEITRYNKAFKNLIKREEVARINRGYIRKLEVTYNAERNDYHPHFHCVLAVNSSYFKKSEYISQDKWLALWRDVMNDQSITQVDVRRVKKAETGKEINELAKYSAKDSDYLISPEVFDSFYHALKGRQLITFNGLFLEANKLFKAHELDKYIEIDKTEYVYLLLYRWGKGEYIEQERRELTEQQLHQANRQLLDESEVD